MREINVCISWLWDGGIDVRLGDEMNGYLAEENVSSTGDIVPWLQEAIAYFYPHSTYPKSLDPQTRERAKTTEKSYNFDPEARPKQMESNHLYGI